MANDNETCPACHQWTREGNEAWRARLKPIYGTDLTQPLPDLIEKLRGDIVKVRGQLHDIGFRYSGWGEHLEHVQGLLTCGLVALHSVREDMKKADEANGKRKLLDEREAKLRKLYRAHRAHTGAPIPDDQDDYIPTTRSDLRDLYVALLDGTLKAPPWAAAVLS